MAQTWQVLPCGRGIHDLSRSPLPLFLQVYIYSSQNYHTYLCSAIGKEKIFLEHSQRFLLLFFFCSGSAFEGIHIYFYLDK